MGTVYHPAHAFCIVRQHVGVRHYAQAKPDALSINFENHGYKNPGDWKYFILADQSLIDDGSADWAYITLSQLTALNSWQQMMLQYGIKSVNYAGYAPRNSQEYSVQAAAIANALQIPTIVIYLTTLQSFLNGDDCAYHEYRNNTPICIVPYPLAGGQCNGQYTLQQAFDILVTHELQEALTNPDTATGWYDSINGWELGDIDTAAWSPYDLSDGHIAQKLWDVQKGHAFQQQDYEVVPVTTAWTSDELRVASNILAIADKYKFPRLLMLSVCIQEDGLSDTAVNSTDPGTSIGVFQLEQQVHPDSSFVATNPWYDYGYPEVMQRWNYTLASMKSWETVTPANRPTYIEQFAPLAQGSIDWPSGLGAQRYAQAVEILELLS